MYHLIELKTPPGASATKATAINASGTVCGTADYTIPGGSGQLASVPSKAMLWDVGGVGTELLPGDPATSSRRALGINDVQRVVGGFTSPAHLVSAFAWDPALPGGIGGTATEYVNLSTDHHYALAAAINDAGLVAGTSAINIFGQGRQAVLWKNSASIVALGSLGGPMSSAQDINEHGQVVGGCGRADGTVVGFLWTPETPNGTSGNMVALPLLPGATKSGATAISRTGAVVGGCSGFKDGARRAFVWWPKTAQASSGTVVDLDALSDAGNTWAFDVNSRGAVVGRSGMYAFLYQNGTMRDLNHLVRSRGWTLSEATAINDVGWITGNGSYNGTQRAFLLIPLSPPEQIANKLRAIAQVWHILFGVRAGEGGIAVPVGGGTPIPVDPVDPVFAAEGLIGPGELDLLASLAISELAMLITDPEVRHRLRDVSLRAAREELERMLREVRRD